MYECGVCLKSKEEPHSWLKTTYRRALQMAGGRHTCLTRCPAQDHGVPRTTGLLNNLELVNITFLSYQLLT